MDPLDQVLADVRAAYSPEPDAKRRVRHGINAAVGATIISGTHSIATSEAPGTDTALGNTPVLQSTTLGLKWGAGIGIGGIVLSSWLALSSSEPPPIAYSMGELALTQDAQPGIEDDTLELGNLRIDVLEEHASRDVVPSASDQQEAARTAHAAQDETRTPSTLIEELRMIRRASQLLREGNSSEARRVLNEHRSRFPNSTLTTERWGLSLILQCKAGTSERVETSARKFLAKAPTSPLAAHVKKQCLP